MNILMALNYVSNAAWLTLVSRTVIGVLAAPDAGPWSRGLEELYIVVVPSRCPRKSAE
jgi:hypothetical protein